ncbi:neurogenic locus notch [Legionella bononiensis]|uniref:Neurogenic locus notch n=1 Tax=Legionella bononiensis TaxID=2793102 RepID=A0ABS1W839_9GAMM|nr:neurogenic locus notch [Legionella bononiensis]MBL7479959.1 neurogenic locus notch [Legionella bononiensis]MBL7525527.1 neurogenic locus notch [Legionella bononiensis]MBL7561710.1 neurogenic locus notch [Legionella bononiensis]
MPSLKTLLISSMLSMVFSPAFAGGCCSKMGGINYCDSSAGRLVCNNGFYSTCYCTRHAVMDLQLLKGCCLWQGGVSPDYIASGLVVCNDGSISEECTLQNPQQSVATW